VVISLFWIISIIAGDALQNEEEIMMRKNAKALFPEPSNKY